MAVARAAARAAGMPDLPMVEIPYVMVGLPDKEVNELADRFFDSIVNELTGARKPAGAKV